MKIELTVTTETHGQTEHVALQVRCNGVTTHKAEHDFVIALLAHIDKFRPTEVGGNAAFKLIDSRGQKDN